MKNAALALALLMAATPAWSGDGAHVGRSGPGNGNAATGGGGSSTTPGAIDFRVRQAIDHARAVCGCGGNTPGISGRTPGETRGAGVRGY